MSFTIATTLDDALAALAAGARPVAGGSDLVVGARHGKAALPDDLVAIDRIDELTFVEVTGDWTCASVRGVNHHTIEHHPCAVHRVRIASPTAARWSARPSTRNVGTLGGNVMNASPAMDTGSPLVVLGAEVELRSLRGSRRVGVAELWTGPGRTSAAAGRALRGHPRARARAAQQQRLPPPRVPPGDGDRRGRVRPRR